MVLAAMLWYSAHCQELYTVEYLGLADGLPTLNINAVAQDSLGLIWFASFGTGLIRYDGSSFKVFDHSPESQLRLNNNHLRDIIVDRKGRLWVANNAGIDIVQPSTLQLVQFVPLAGNDESLRGQACSLCLTPDGDIWVAAYNKGVFCFRRGDPNRLELVQEIPEAIYINQTSNARIYCISAKGEIYCYNNGRFVPIKYHLNPLYADKAQIKPVENPEGLLVGFRLLLPDGLTNDFQIDLLTEQLIPGLPSKGITVHTSSVMIQKMLETASPLNRAALYEHAFKNSIDNQGIIWVAPEYGGVFKLNGS